ncbi:diguanylate cyclase domain-containing protein [Pelovirga terrestris]|uniref:Diguanylate cyclase n=1 Tax=Pelovirga terrestris TaxID=2771352 RepID=A0A8J6QQ20_9BACT|nr:diguanylate cyclase [Pelovirga terrestris]MBD1400811.1 diguanylate cyclase [Pelovirga terrestris]
MPTSAIIFAVEENRRQLLAQRINDLQLFDQLYFSGTAEELKRLVKNTAADLICCELDVSEDTLPPWADLVRKGFCRVLCFTDKQSRIRLRLPTGSGYVDSQIDPSSLKEVIRSQLDAPLESPPPPATGINEQVAAEQKVYSRFYFDTFLGKELSRSQLTGRPVSLLLLEPQLTQRHQKDQQLLEPFLVRVTLAIKNQIRSSDLLCRYQRQRLAILLPETPSERAADLLERILIGLRNSFPEQRIPWTSVIVCPTPTDPENPYSLMQQAITQLERSQPRF